MLRQLSASAGKILGHFVSKNFSKAFKCSEVPCKHGAHGLLELLSNLFKTQPSDMPEVQHTLVGLCKPSDGLPEGFSGVLVDLLVLCPVLAAGAGHGREHLSSHRDGLSLAAAHLIPEPIHGDSEDPCLEFALLHIGASLARHGAEG